LVSFLQIPKGLNLSSWRGGAPQGNLCYETKASKDERHNKNIIE